MLFSFFFQTIILQLFNKDLETGKKHGDYFYNNERGIEPHHHLFV